MARARLVIERAGEAGRSHLGFLLGLALLIFVPLGLLGTLDELVAELGEDADNELVVLSGVLSGIVVGVSSLLGQLLYSGAVAAALLHPEPQGSPSLRVLLRQARWGRLAAIDALFAVGLLVSLLALLVPGVLFFARYVLAPPLADVEGTGVREAFRRSAEVTSGARRLVLALLLSVLAASALVESGLDAVIGAIGGDGFLVDWATAAVASIATNPPFALLSIGLVIVLAGPKAGRGVLVRER